MVFCDLSSLGVISGAFRSTSVSFGTFLVEGLRDLLGSFLIPFWNHVGTIVGAVLV